MQFIEKVTVTDWSLNVGDIYKLSMNCVTGHVSNLAKLHFLVCEYGNSHHT